MSREFNLNKVLYMVIKQLTKLKEDNVYLTKKLFAQKDITFEFKWKFFWYRVRLSFTKRLLEIIEDYYEVR